MVSATSLFGPGAQHWLHNHQGEIIESVYDVPMKATVKWANSISSSIILTWFYIKTQICIHKNYVKEKVKYYFKQLYKVLKKYTRTSEPVNEVGSWTTNWATMVGSVENFVKKNSTSATASSSLTTPEATMT